MATINVKDKYRTNPLSHQPGGYEVTVVYEEGLRLVYDKVKKPGAYIKNIEDRGHDNGRILEIFVDGNRVWDQTHDRDPWDI